MFLLDLGTESHYTTLGLSPNASAAEIGEARSHLQTSLKIKQRTANEKERAEIDEQIKRINAAGEAISRPDKRKEYDQANAHLVFFLDRSAAAPCFTSKVERFFLLHRALREHLLEKGCDIAPLSDLERDDFSADETPNELLDRLLADS
jgi:curved DNA-binding protein CbpA